MRRLAVLGLALAIGMVGPASAQTIDNAYAFVDQVMQNGATQVIFPNSMSVAPQSSTSRLCSTVIAFKDSVTTITIDWREVAGVTPITDYGSTPGLTIVGGVSHFYQSGFKTFTDKLTKTYLATNSSDMDPRLAKAISVIREGCAKPSQGF